MTDPEGRTLERARKLLALWRGAVGGEKAKAHNVLVNLLAERGLTLRDLDPSLPPVRDPDQLTDWREADAWLAALDGTPEQVAEAVGQLVDAEGLSEAERRQVLQKLDLGRLAESRADGWLHGQPDPEITPEHLIQAARALTDEQVARHPARSIAEATLQLALLGAARLARPERRLRADSELQAAFVAALCSARSGIPARSLPPEPGQDRWQVIAYLSPDELAGVRSLIVQGEQHLRQTLLAAARDLGARLGRR